MLNHPNTHASRLSESTIAAGWLGMDAPTVLLGVGDLPGMVGIITAFSFGDAIRKGFAKSVFFVPSVL